jgi:hypothetical protein
MRRALGGKLKLEFVDGTIPVVLDQFDPSFRAWNRCNMLVHSWILNSVSDSIAQSLVFMENVVDVWNDLKERFSQGDLVRIAELQQKIYALKQDWQSVTECYSALKLLWEELELYLPISACTCRERCSCDAMRAARTNHTLLHVVRFLTGLNENFTVVKSQILLMDPLPPLNKVFLWFFNMSDKVVLLLPMSLRFQLMQLALRDMLQNHPLIVFALSVVRITTLLIRASRSMDCNLIFVVKLLLVLQLKGTMMTQLQLKLLLLDLQLLLRIKLCS